MVKNEMVVLLCVRACVRVCVSCRQQNLTIFGQKNIFKFPSVVALAVVHSNAVGLLLLLHYLFLIALLVGSFCLLMQFKMSL